jgi:hypothetical protein
MTQSIADLPLAERHEIMRAWLNDLTTVYEQCAAERDALRRVVEVIQARHAKGGFCLCGFTTDIRGKPFHGLGCPVAAYEALKGETK